MTDGKKDLNEFIARWAVVQGRQLEAIRDDLQQLIEAVLTSLSEMNSATENKAREADETIVSVCTDPDAETQNAIDVVQKSTQDIVDRATEQLTKGDQNADISPEMISGLRRISSKFSKHMEALSTLDNDMKELIMKVMGALSSDDVIRQRLDHVIAACANMYTELESADAATSADGIFSVRAKLLSDLYKSYTSESEKEVFHGIFGRPVNVRKAS